jgi:tRNAThr (cytosine32-N3)-methyltransferase
MGDNDNTNSNTNSNTTQDPQKQQQQQQRQSALENPFGGRLLTDENKVFDYNAWDNVPWDEEQEQEALKIVSKQAQNPVPEDKRDSFNELAANHWDKFYSMHTNSFFKVSCSL